MEELMDAECLRVVGEEIDRIIRQWIIKFDQIDVNASEV